MQYACNGECYRSPFFEVPHCREPTYLETGEYADDEHGATMNTNPLHLESGAAHPVAKPHRVGLKDIADELGISQTAVSFAINDRPGVSEETKRRVKEAASKLGWSRCMRRRRSAHRRP